MSETISSTLGTTLATSGTFQNVNEYCGNVHDYYQNVNDYLWSFHSRNIGDCVRHLLVVFDYSAVDENT